MPVCWYKAGTNGMVYKQLVTQLPDFDDELTNILPYYAMTLAELGSGGRSYIETQAAQASVCLLYTSPSPRDATLSRMPSSA